MATVVSPTIDVRGVASDEELRQANDLMARSHRPAYETALAWLESFGATYPGYQREHTRVAFIEGVVAGALRLTTETVRIGEARLKMGGLGWVSTALSHRHKGVASRLIEDTTRYMLSHGYHVSMLFGIPNFYHRFGYATTLAEYAIVMETSEAQSVPPNRYRVRSIKPGDIPSLQRIHELSDRGTACSIVRSRAHFTNRWNKFRDGHVLTDERGKVVAYMHADEDGGALHVKEAAAESNEVAAHLLAYTGDLAGERLLPSIRFSLPPDTPLARYLGQFESRHEKKLSRQSGGMMTLIDIGEALEMLVPEWESLLRESAMAEGHREVTLLCAGRPYRIRSHHDAVEVSGMTGRNRVHLNPETLMQLVAGYARVQDVLGAYRGIVPRESRLFLQALFPNREPYVHLMDRF